MHISKLRDKFSNYDFSKHKVFVNDNKHTLALSEKQHCESVNFINYEGILLVSGDFGRWTFCRRFDPSPDGYVSGSYWIEKLEAGSTQNPYIFCGKTAALAIKEKMREVVSNHLEELEEVELTDAVIDKFLNDFKNGLTDISTTTEVCNNLIWLRAGLKYGFTEYREFEHWAINERPDHLDGDEVPEHKKLHHQLAIVFDAFNEICKRLK